MTVIAWDGESLAVDKLACNSGYGSKVKKGKRLSSGEVAACCGDHEHALILVKWYEDGCNPETWPKFQATDDWTRLVIASKNKVKFYEKEPVPQTMDDKFQAWGSGRDYALGAMAAGATAKEAVKIANNLCIYCGKGVDVFSLKEKINENDHSR